MCIIMCDFWSNPAGSDSKVVGEKVLGTRLIRKFSSRNSYQRISIVRRRRSLNREIEKDVEACQHLENIRLFSNPILGITLLTDKTWRRLRFNRDFV